MRRTQQVRSDPVTGRETALMVIDGRDLPIDVQSRRGSLLDDVFFIVSRFNRLPLGICAHEGDGLLLYALAARG